jgi:hypothetical protein
MNRTEWLQDRRMQKFRDVLSRCERRELSGMEVGELLGCSERKSALPGTLRGEGLDGLLDRRLGKASGRRAAQPSTVRTGADSHAVHHWHRLPRCARTCPSRGQR